MKKKAPFERFTMGFRESAYSEQTQSGRCQHYTVRQASASFVRLGVSFLGAIFALMCSGCTGVNNPLLSSGPHPRVEDCAVVQKATPTRYVCDGKIYTSVQLDEISKGEQVQLSEQAAQGAFPGNVINSTGNFGTYPQGGAPGPGSGGH
jgi:hypothetical protein